MQPTKSPSSARIALPAAVLLAGLSLYLWNANRKTQAEVERLARENAAMRQQAVAAVESAPPPQASPPAAPTDEVPPAPPAPSTATPAPPALVMTPTGEAPPPRSEGLKLAGTKVRAIEGGWQTRLSFTSQISEDLGIVSVVVRVPRGSNARILELNPAASNLFRDVAQRITEDGRFAVFNAVAGPAPAVDFLLSVSEPCVLDVRGTCGIGPYDLDVGPGGAEARRKP